MHPQTSVTFQWKFSIRSIMEIIFAVRKSYFAYYYIRHANQRKFKNVKNIFLWWTVRPNFPSIRDFFDHVPFYFYVVLGSYDFEISPFSMTYTPIGDCLPWQVVLLITFIKILFKIYLEKKIFSYPFENETSNKLNVMTISVLQ